MYFTTTERETEIVFRPEAWSRHEPSTLPASAHKIWREVEGHTGWPITGALEPLLWGTYTYTYMYFYSSISLSLFSKANCFRISPFHNQLVHSTFTDYLFIPGTLEGSGGQPWMSFCLKGSREDSSFSLGPLKVLPLLHFIAKWAAWSCFSSVLLRR